MLNQGRHMKARNMKAIVFAGFVMVAAQAGLGAQDSLSTAKELYASAAYEDALSTLTRLTEAPAAPSACMRWVAPGRQNRLPSRSSGENR
jgi:hypothetical protein